VLTARETTGSHYAPFPQPKTRVWGSPGFGTPRIGASSDLSPISRWACTLCSYDSASARLVYPNGVSSSFTYDSLNRVTQAGLNKGSALATYNYTLGATGNRQAAVESSGRMVNWNYDGIYRLTQETISGGTANGAVSYGLDPVGNRLSQSSTLAGIPSGNFAPYDADDRMMSTEQYDNNGNTAQSGARTFKYDFQNRLKSMTNGAVTIQYDGDGNRVAKAANGTTTKYLVDDLNPTGYAQVVEELTNGAVTRTYTYGLQRINQNQLINNAWTPSFYGYDGMGSVRMLTDATGAVTDTYDFDGWGNTVHLTGATPNLYLYRGEQYDPDLQLYYLRARYFNPLTGRFLTRDPVSGKMADPKSLHKYLYAGGNPINVIDPTGRAGFFEDAFLTAKNVVQTAKQIGYVHLQVFAYWGCTAAAMAIAYHFVDNPIPEDSGPTYANLVDIRGILFAAGVLAIAEGSCYYILNGLK
jgi:RHS repeat-associated protein